MARHNPLTPASTAFRLGPRGIVAPRANATPGITSLRVPTACARRARRCLVLCALPSPCGPAAVHASSLLATLHDHATEVVEEFPDIRVIEGHDITELAVKQATKGDGIRLLARAGEPTAMGYLGDDVTDEDAFAALDELTDSRALNAGLTVKVGSAPTRASRRIADPTAVAELLGRLAAERTEFLRTVHG